MTSSEGIAIEVSPALAGIRLDRAVSMVVGVSRSAARELLTSSAVSLDGVVAKVPSVKLELDQLLEVGPMDREDLGDEPGSGPAFDVVYEDEAVVVVDKPAGLVVHGGPGVRGGTLASGLRSRFSDIDVRVRSGALDPVRPGIIHRLDKGTSGLLVVARTPEAVEQLGDQMRRRAIERRYRALVWGLISDDAGTIEAPVGRSVRNRTKMAVTQAGRFARTHYIVERRFPGSDGEGWTLVTLRLDTGRTHQIRVHLGAIQHPIVGDATYGPRHDIPGSLARPFLHAGRLSFDHPDSGCRMEFSSDLPSDLAAVLSGLSDA